MLQSFAVKYRKPVACSLLTLFYLQTVILPLHAAVNAPAGIPYTVKKTYRSAESKSIFPGTEKRTAGKTISPAILNAVVPFEKSIIPRLVTKADIGGPSSPEASSFKAVGSDNLVNLFTGDFSYSIPLLDVGGYPVNLFYSGGISMEQEAGWVGLGWNVNPGTVNRNMRGVPDDFNGEDKLIQTQNVKPNRTWGGEIGVDGEALGFKKPKVNLSLGFSYNNYLGPAIDIGAGVSLSIPITESIKHDKEAPKGDSVGGLSASISLNAKLSSRSGLTLSPSLNASLHSIDNHLDCGAGISTSYNSRTGIKELNISSQASHYRNAKKEDGSASTKYNISRSITSSSISFARPSYIPTLRMPMQYSNYSGQIELGAGMFGLRGAAHGQGYYSESKIPNEWKVVYKPLVGFIYSEKANGNKDAVMDFSRLNDAEVTPRTPILSAPQYAYDVFSIQGEGTGGTIRAYRGDLGFMRDNETVSKDNNISLGFDIAPPGHFGGNWNIISTPTKAGGWNDGNNTLLQTLAFKPKATNTLFENVYFRNPGEVTVTNPEIIERIGGDDLVRFKLGGSNVNTRLESTLQQFDKHTLSYKADNAIAGKTTLTNRDKRTQVTTMLTAGEATAAGLEKDIRNYGSNSLSFTTLDRVSSLRKTHHISEIDVLENSGMRYVYGLPVYNIKQKDFTFSVDNTGNALTGLVNFNADEPTIGSHHMENKAKHDGYMMSQETPGYASAFLLTGLLSPDYVDLTGNGVSEDDAGTAVKFDYTYSGITKWRTPRNNSTAKTSHFNEGVRSEMKDDKATISYGEREVWYLGAIESKSMVAIFKTDNRDDAKGVLGETDGRFDVAENANKKLTRIDLYTKADIKANGVANARPVKTVHFGYSYTLCNGTPDNKNGGGKLTLDSVYFSYNGQPRLKKDLYIFNYGSTSADNPSYANNASDRWGTYKNPDTNPGTNPAANPAALVNADYPFTSGNKIKNDEFAAAWSLKKILLPSGGQMEVQYEADDYAYVQNKRACDMFNIYGLGNTTNFSSNAGLYNPGIPGNDNFYVYVQLPSALQNTTAPLQKQEIYDKYLEGMNQLAFKLLIKMPKDWEPLTVYTKFTDYGLCSNSTGKDIIFLRLEGVDGKSPLAKTAISYLTESLPGQAFEGYETEVNNVGDFIGLIGTMLGSLKTAFTNPDQQMRSAGKARMIWPEKSFVRLADPDKIKYGGGLRVKRVLVKDNWQKMTNTFTSTYGQDYDYTKREIINGKDTVISSGVASYEPGLGSEENPFREIVSFSNKMPLASAQYGAIEMPMLDGLYPSPGVGYSKVTVRSIHRKGTHGDSTLRSAIGKQVSEFFTAREYPVHSAYTPMDSRDYHYNSFLNILRKEITDRRVTSQGFLVETNDMHGKMKSQAAYSEKDENTPLSSSYHYYKNTGRNGLNDKVDFVETTSGGKVAAGNMGIDMELMTDVREFSVNSNGFNGQIQSDFFTFVPFPIFAIPMLPIRTITENKYRSVTCTKHINYHAIEDSVIVMDKGSVVSTKTTVYDAETGSPVVTKTGNEFNDPIYNVNYPAYWAYSSTAPAYKNIDAKLTGNFVNGAISMSQADQNKYFESGDELYIISRGNTADNCTEKSGGTIKLWVYDKNKNTTCQNVVNKDLVFMDVTGNLFNNNDVVFRIIRSGKRNTAGQSLASFSMMNDPVGISGGIKKIILNSSSKMVAASAVEFKEKWQSDNDLFTKRSNVYDNVNCLYSEADDCATGQREKIINPYIKGLLGNLRSHKSYVFYGNRVETLSDQSKIRKQGFLESFSSYWVFDGNDNLIQNNPGNRWVWNNEITRVNAKGQELETKNALDIFTGAQYAYLKNQAVAVANNSRVNEMFAENFEDYNYDESLNTGNFQNGCAKKHIDFSPIFLYGTAITDATTSGVNAHSGTKCLKVPAGGSAALSQDVKDANYDYTFNFGRDTAKSLAATGDNFGLVFSTPQGATNQYFPNSCFNFSLIPEDSVSNDGAGHCYEQFAQTYAGYTYAEVAADGMVTFTLTSFAAGSMAGSVYSATASLIIYDSTGTVVGNMYSTNFSNANNGDVTQSFCLKKGFYKLSVTCSAAHYNSYGCGDIVVVAVGSYHFDLGANIPICYKTIHAEDACVFNTPISATDSMINPVFSPENSKKMLFSGWVKENCITPCVKDKFDSTGIHIQFNDGSITSLNMKASGPIIEGWQKVEGIFTIPAGCTNMSLNFFNSSSAASYWDDIRIHPFNSNMKSYVYDSRTLKLSAELDENNYASFYEYDEEGQLVRVKKETAQGVKTITETRSSKQKVITAIQ